MSEYYYEITLGLDLDVMDDEERMYSPSHRKIHRYIDESEDLSDEQWDC